MKNIAIVILNYLNYKETELCIESIKKLYGEIVGIIIVDNFSNNDSVQYLRKRYQKEQNIYILETRENLGFAKGNNVGIEYAKQKLNADTVVVVNSDVIFEDPNFLEIVRRDYESNSGVIGVGIKLTNGYIKKKYLRYITFKEACIEYMNLWVKYLQVEALSKYLPQHNLRNRVQILQGCCLIFTPEFFQYYKGFYPNTFLYNEEDILYLMCKSVGLKQQYINDTYIFHKEEQSSKMSFNHDVYLKYRQFVKSYKYVLYWILKVNIGSFFKNRKFI